MHRQRTTRLLPGKKNKGGFGFILWPLLLFTVGLYGIIAFIVLKENTNEPADLTDLYDDDKLEQQRHHSLDSLVMEGLPPKHPSAIMATGVSI